MAIDKSTEMLALTLGRYCQDKEYALRIISILSESEVARLLVGRRVLMALSEIQEMLLSALHHSGASMEVKR
ncbi:MAG: hypothetical protein J5699_00230 [Bacteroidales bacterium]|nr:hypothetical protein [Bacteroidales bacterium]